MITPLTLSIPAKIFATLLLALLAVAGNVLNVPLFFGVSFIFGSVAVMLAVALLGTLPALLVAIAGGLYTLALWGHPYALVIFTAEALAVALLYRRGLRNLVLADLAYWLVLGVPLVLLFYRGVIGMGWEAAFLIALKQPLNGLFNALVAGLIVIGLQLSGLGARHLGMAPPRLPSLLFHVLLTAILLAGAVPILHEGATQRDLREAFLTERLTGHGRSLAGRLEMAPGTGREIWQAQLAMGQWGPEMGLALVDRDGRILASQGSVVSVAAPAAQLQALEGGLSLWSPAGDMPLMPRWKQGRYRVSVPVGTGAYLVVEQAAVPLVKTLERGALTSFGYLAGLLLLGVLAARGLSRWLTRPLSDLEAASGTLAVQVAEGLRPVLPASRVQEYGSLGHTLQDMAERLAGSFRALRQAQASLEAQIAVRTAELNQFRSTLDRTLDCVFMFDAETLRFFYANEGALRQVGYTREELLAMHPYDIKPDISAAQFHELIAPLLAGKQTSLTFETVHQHKSGRRLTVEIFLQYIAPADEPARFVAIVRDISERKAVELELRESELRFRSMLETCPTAARIARSGGRDVIFSNQRYAELINAAPGQTGGVDPAAYYAHSEDYVDILLRLGKGEQIFDRLIELTIPGAGTKWTLASYLPIQYQGSPAVLGWFYDITDRKHAEAALAEQARHTQAILDYMVDGLITIDEHGIIDSANPAAEHMFGYSAAELQGQNVKMLMPSPHRDAHDGYLRNYQATGVARIIGIGREVEGQRRDGSQFPMDLAISEVSHHGRPIYVGIVRDITERKRMERMKSEFVSTVSHELRTPLTSISGALGLMVGGALGDLPAQAQQMIFIAHKNSQRLTHLINDLLDMEKIAAGKLHFEMQPQALMPLIEQALEANRAYGAERRVTLALTGAAPGVEVRVDSQRLQQVLANLLSNAIKFSPEGGTVNVAVEATAETATVTVADQGTGIPESFRARIFQKFSQADASDTRQKGGTGLGLAITRELVERMGGSIGFESVEGDGARFFFELPLWHPAATGVATGALCADETGAPRILVVEDEPDVAHLLGRMLTRGGYQVDIAGSGAEALAALQQTPYAAVSLDLMLPDISGLDIIRQVRQRPETADLPIVVVSAKMEEGRLAINGDFSGIDWLPKPIDETRLLGVVERQLSTTGAPHPRVLHVEDDADLHQVIRAMVGERFDFELATTLLDARARVALERFDVVILDLSLPDGSGWDLLPEIRARQPDARVVILSGTDMTGEEARKVEAALLKSQASPRELLDALSTRIQSSRPKGVRV